MPRWHGWRRSAIMASATPDAADMARRHKVRHHRRETLNQYFDQLIFFKAVDVCHKRCGVAEFEEFARSCCDGTHPDWAAYVYAKPSETMARADTARHTARKIAKAKHAIDVIDVDELLSE